ncbi:hypothetical protein [Pseudomonas sp. NPDC079086]|uniref:hypothetical protein n=1 Tax=unclassified Pseudomonas TaxID=196821 RepID=UPI0037C50400
MSYREEAIKILLKSYPEKVPEFKRVYDLGRAKILAAQYLFRLMSKEKAAEWSRVAPPISKKMDASLMRYLFVGGGGYTSKWFTFDRPYLFRRQTINQLGGREGQGLLMVIPLEHEMKNTLIKKLPDTNLEGVPQHMKTDSCRCKVEGGTITLVISLPVLEKMAINMSIAHLGARITPH